MGAVEGREIFDYQPIGPHMLKANLKGLKMRERQVKRAVEGASVDPLLKCALRVERAAKTSMTAGGARGRIGPRGGYIREPSAPGTPPHVQTGALRASIQSAKTGKTAVVGPTEKYGKIHEFGSRSHPQRPFMRPALRRTKDKFKSEFRDLNLKRHER